MIRYLSALLALFLVCAAQAQTTQQSSLYFDLDKAELSAEAQSLLLQLSQNLATVPDYDIKINAFTDNSGSKEYNDQLAMNRGLAVQTYLAERGIVTEKTVLRGWGEQKQQFSNRTEEGRQKNRRVDLDITIWNINDANTFFERLLGKKDQFFPINPQQGQTITTSGGVVVVVPPNAFVDRWGNPPAGMVSVTVKEALRPGDWIANGLSTMSNGEMLQSGGMIEVNAYANGEMLSLATDAELTVGIPAQRAVDPEMRLFYGQRDLPALQSESEDGAPNPHNTVANNPEQTSAMTWDIASGNASFRQTLETDEYKRTMNEALAARMATFKVPVPAKAPAPVFAELATPKLPVEPTKPRVKAVPPNREQINKKYTKNDKMTAKQAKRAQEEYAMRYKYYLQDSAACDRSLQNYNAQYNAYLADKAAFDAKYTGWQTELRRRVSVIEKFKDERYAHYYAIALNNVCKSLGKAKKPLKFTNLEKTIIYRCERVADLWIKKDVEFNTANTQLLMYRMDIGNTKLGKVNNKYVDASGPLNLYYGCNDDACKFDLMKNVVDQTPIAAISDSLFALDKEKIMASGSASTKKQKMDMYISEISNLGWINVDRFYKSQEPRIALQFEEQDAFAMYALFPKLNSMLMMYKNEAGVFTTSGVPVGQEFDLITVKTKEGKIWLDRQKMTAGQSKPPAFAFKPYSMMDIRKEFAGL